MAKLVEVPLMTNTILIAPSHVAWIEGRGQKRSDVGMSDGRELTVPIEATDLANLLELDRKVWSTS